MRLTLIHPCIGRRLGQPYIRTWQMEPLPPAVIAGLTPPDVEVAFYDDRMEHIPYNEPTDLVAISVETYTAKRAYQIASEYRRRGVPVVMGGFHATLCPEEVSQYAEAVVVGEAEGVWEQVLRDAERDALQTFYRSAGRPSLANLRPQRSIYKGKNYLPIGLVEAGRGCHFKCDFCAVQTVFNHSQTRRPTDDILSELETMRHKPLIFFVDDNITSNMAQAKEFFRALIPLKIRWVSQASINAAYDEEFLQLITASGCQGLLIGFESLNPENLKKMNKGFNLMQGGFEQALANLRRHNVRLYITFVFGYDEDTEASFPESVAFALRHKFYIAAFNHLTPFPGTPLYYRLDSEGRLLYERWWLDDAYSYNKIPFQPRHMTPERLQRGCVEARAEFYSLRNIWQRGLDPVNRSNSAMWWHFYGINYLFRREVRQRDYFPLGDEAWRGELIKVRERAEIAMPVVSFDLATDADNSALRRLLRENPLPGSVAVTFEREPSYFRACAVEGPFHQTIVGRHSAAGRVVGFGNRAVREMYVNGKVQAVGYLSQLRADAAQRWGLSLARIIAQGFAFFHHLHADNRAPFYLMSIIADNTPARRLLTSSLKGMPRLSEYTRYHTYAIFLGRRKPALPLPRGLTLARATAAYTDAIVECLQRNGQRYQFAPYWTTETIFHPNSTPGFRPTNFLLATMGDRVAGCLAGWDQSSFKQTVVRGYSGALKRWRPLINLAASLAGWPPLPDVGSPIRHCFASHLAVDGDDPAVFAALLRAVYNDTVERRFGYLMLGLAETHPFRPVVESYRHILYPSQLYLVAWADGWETIAKVDWRTPGVEAAVL